jgi:glycosyltransferase involved in cell wall biosynthesis/polysaccharide pyruvyl transferase WcaK-like protein
MVKRVVLINDASTARGGATGLALLAVRLLTGAGLPITYIVGDDGANPEFASLNVDVVALNGQHIANGFRGSAAISGIYNSAAESLLTRWIQENDDPETVYHIHGWSKILSPAIFRALQPVATRTVLHAHDFFLACPNGGFYDYRHGQPCVRTPLGIDCITTDCDKRSYSQKLWRVMRQQALKILASRQFSDTPIVMIHEGMADYFIRSGIHASRLRVLRNPVERLIDERVKVERNSLFHFIGRVETEKGIWDAAAACRQANVALRIIGDGPEQPALKGTYPEIDFQGWSSRQKLGELIKDARAVVMPSHYPEPFGLVAAEASRSGIPVILSNTALLASEFARYNLGFSCNTRNIKEFGAAMRKVAELDESTIRDMSEHAFQAKAPIASAPSTWCDGLVELYEERLRAHSSSATQRTVSADAKVKPSVANGPSIRLFNVKYSPNLGDGLLSEALERALHEQGADREGTTSVDLAARAAYGGAGGTRSLMLRALNALPNDLRQRAIQVPLQLMLRQKWLPHYESQLGAADAVVIGGGNLFTDMDLNFPVKLAAVLNLVSRRHLPIAIYGVGVSGDWSEQGLHFMRTALSGARLCYISVRDEPSQENFNLLFADSAGLRAELVRDPGLLTSRYIKPSITRNPTPRVGLCITSGIAVRYHSHVNISDIDLGEWYASLCEGLTRRGYVVDVFTNGSPEDEHFLDLLSSRLDSIAEGTIYRKRLKAPTELATFSASLDVLVAHRMHALIAAYSYGVPIFALRWDRKVDAFMASIGEMDCIASTQISTLRDVLERIDSLLQRPSGHREGHSEVLEEAYTNVGGLYRALVSATRSQDESITARIHTRALATRVSSDIVDHHNGWVRGVRSRPTSSEP